jgi:hypothetical protein
MASMVEIRLRKHTLISGCLSSLAERHCERRSVPALITSPCDADAAQDGRPREMRDRAAERGRQRERIEREREAGRTVSTILRRYCFHCA